MRRCLVFISSRTVIVDYMVKLRIEGNVLLLMCVLVWIQSSNTTMGLWGKNYTKQWYFLCQSAVVHMLCTQLLGYILCPPVWLGNQSFLSFITSVCVLIFSQGVNATDNCSTISPQSFTSHSFIHQWYACLKVNDTSLQKKTSWCLVTISIFEWKHTDRM